MLQKLLPRVIFLIGAMVILFMSMTRASLDLMAKDDKTESVKRNEINFTSILSNGETATGSYKFPDTGMMTDNIFYGLKRIRDFFWIQLSRGDNKVELILLMADKKMMEFQKLAEKGNTSLAAEAGNEAIDKLEYASRMLSQLNTPNEKQKQLRQQVFWAGLAYKATAERVSSSFDLDRDKYSKLLNRIDDWNKEEEKNRYTWDF